MALTLSVGATSAFAFTVEPTDHGTALIVRESTDSTAAVSAIVSFDYKGNLGLGYWDSAYPPANAGSYNTSWVMGVVSGAAPCNSAEVPLNTSQVRQIVRVVQGGSYYNFPIWYQPASVVATVAAMPSVSATITDMPAVALESSISVDGTLPVNVADLPPGVWGAIGLGVLVLGVAFTSVAIAGVRRAR